jgi:hypothetical protein
LVLGVAAMAISLKARIAAPVGVTSDSGKVDSSPPAELHAIEVSEPPRTISELENGNAPAKPPSDAVKSFAVMPSLPPLASARPSAPPAEAQPTTKPLGSETPALGQLPVEKAKAARGKSRARYARYGHTRRAFPRR